LLGTGFAFWSPFFIGCETLLGLAVRGDGLGKNDHIAKIAAFFAVSISSPAFTAPCIAGLNYWGHTSGRLDSVAAWSPVAAGNMFVAYWTADHEALVSVFSDPGKFYVADPYTFLFVP